MIYWKVFLPKGRFLRWVSDRNVAELWAIATGGYYEEVDVGGPNWTPEDQEAYHRDPSRN